MAALSITRETYRDKVYGGWLGKSIGGTLGAPLEGGKLLHDLTFYEPIPGQAAANDDLDIQLVWLHALRGRGIDLTSDDLAEEWLDHIAYPWDEYGYAVCNVRRGLRPPLSGYYNNWFRDSFGAAIRTEIWAMVAPGSPQVAAAYAYHDAVFDHAEEGVWAAMFWAAVESAAFFLTDARQLLDVGLAMIPASCRVARAVGIARDSAFEQKTLADARARIIAEVGRENSTDAAQNTGFVVLGWLYGGGDFGRSICAAVNCGYDTDSTGATLGALLGILKGKSGLPKEWLDPIGDAVVIGWGVKNLKPELTAAELTDHTVEVGEKVIAARCPDVALADGLSAPAAPEPSADAADATSTAGDRARYLEIDAPAAGAPVEAEAPDASAEADTAAPEAAETVAAPTEEPAAEPVPVPEPEPAAGPVREPAPTPSMNWRDNSKVKPLLVTPPSTATYEAGQFEITTDYGEAGPAVIHNTAASLVMSIRNNAAEPFLGRVALKAPAGWQVAVPGVQGERQMLAPGGMARFGFVIRVPDTTSLTAVNTITLVLTPEDGAAATTCDISLLGGACWWVVGPFDNTSDEGFDRSFAPQDRPGTDQTYAGRTGAIVSWQRRSAKDAILELDDVLGGLPGVLYARTIVRMPTRTPVKLVPHTNDGLVMWLNKKQLIRRHSHEPMRPTLSYGPAAVDAVLEAGPNDITIKLVRCREPLQFAFNIVTPEGLSVPNLDWSHWE